MNDLFLGANQLFAQLRAGRGDGTCDKRLARHGHLVVDDARNDDIRLEEPQQLDLARSPQVDERPGVGDDDHPGPKVPSSRSRSSAE